MIDWFVIVGALLAYSLCLYRVRTAEVEPTTAIRGDATDLDARVERAVPQSGPRPSGYTQSRALADRLVDQYGGARIHDTGAREYFVRQLDQSRDAGSFHKLFDEPGGVNEISSAKELNIFKDTMISNRRSRMVLLKEISAYPEDRLSSQEFDRRVFGYMIDRPKGSA